MTVLSGIGGKVDLDTNIREWKIRKQRIRQPFSSTAVGNAFDGGVARACGVQDWRGYYTGYGYQPTVFPGDGFTFTGEIGPDAGQSLTAEATHRKIGFVRDAAGPRWSKLVLNARVLLVAVAKDAVAAAGELGRPLALSADEVMASPHAFVGDLDRIADHILACRERYGVSYFTVSQEALTSLAPLVAKLAGQ